MLGRLCSFYFGLEVEDGDWDGYYGSDDYRNDDGFGFIYIVGKERGEVWGMSFYDDFRVLFLEGFYIDDFSLGMFYFLEYIFFKSVVFCFWTYLEMVFVMKFRVRVCGKDREEREIFE